MKTEITKNDNINGIEKKYRLFIKNEDKLKNEIYSALAIMLNNTSKIHTYVFITPRGRVFLSESTYNIFPDAYLFTTINAWYNTKKGIINNIGRVNNIIKYEFKKYKRIR